MLRVIEAESSIEGLVAGEEGLVLISALKAMLEINRGKACHLAVTLLDHGDKEVVKAALEILLHTDGAWIDDFCDRLVAHESWDIRSLFIKALAGHRGKKAIPVLQESLKTEPDDLVRQQISDLIGDLS
jgi:HEAT repeat protein